MTRSSRTRVGADHTTPRVAATTMRGTGPFVLVATSYGALVARMYANEYPDDERVDFEAALDGVVAHRDAQDASQRRVAQLVPDAEHITETHSGHDIMLENPEPVSQAIGDVIAAVRDGRTSVES